MKQIRAESSVEAFILAGGRSHRFGRDKALAELQGRPLLGRALDVLAEVGLPATVVSPRVDAYRSLTDRFLTNERPDLGPVEGLRVVLEGCRSDWALLLSVDMPWVDAVTLRVLLNIDRTSEQAICFADQTGLRHPFPGLYKGSLHPLIKRQGEGGSMQRLLDEASPRLIVQSEVPSGPDLEQVLRNVNRPEDLA